MRKLITAALLLASSFSYAAGPYDGIWEITPLGYGTVSERDGVFILVFVYNEDYGETWSAYQGQRINNVARISSIRGHVTSVFDLVFESDASLKITQISCTPNTNDYICLFPNGFVLTASKVW